MTVRRVVGSARALALVACGVVGSVVGLAATGRAQVVSIAPQTIVVDAKTNSASVTLVNRSDAPAEVSLSTMYGYPDTDQSGAMFLRTFQTLPDTAPSAAGWIQIFPQKFRLEPRGRRTVRLLVTPPRTLAQREYWSRLVVTVRGGRIAGAAGKDTTVQVGLALEVRSVLPLFYRNGSVTTGVHFDSVRVARAGDSLVVRPILRRTGTAAFLGTVTATLRDAKGKAVAEGVLPLGVYYALTPRIPMFVRGVPAGTYTLAVSVTSSRTDVAPGLLVHAQPVRKTVEYLLK